GMAITKILEHTQDITLALWDVDASRVPGMQPLEHVVRDADIVFLCVSSWALRTASESVLPFISSDTIIISPTKGIEEGTLTTSDEILEDVFKGKGIISLMHGPMLAPEITQGLPAFAVLAVQDKNAYTQVQELFSGTLLQLEYSHDLHGVAVAGVLKNIYSIGLGMADAMLLGSNFRGWFVRVAIQEMESIITALGGDDRTAVTGAGLGDLIATGFSPHSRNCKVGHEIVQSGECITVSEGASSLPQMIQLLESKNIQAPLCRGISDIVSGNRSAQDIDKIVRSCLL
ncbi:MAG TPA: NAD(P)H-dependent glycerol-3-phosphate dehydrogenase, partial [Candidatus Andersenbacteria bacterium]|nr:NAD(P)H-dependent glycerol-3-phosphate dehydrogenase [Candidatus Andersenbacteria bacterium]